MSLYIIYSGGLVMLDAVIEFVGWLYRKLRRNRKTETEFSDEERYGFRGKKIKYKRIG